MKKMGLLSFLILFITLSFQTQGYCKQEISMEVEDGLKKYLSVEAIKEKNIEGERYYRVKGLLGKSRSVKSTKAIITAKFFDATDQLINEEEKYISLNHSSILHFPKLTVPYFIDAPYNDTIVRCEMSIVWI